MYLDKATGRRQIAPEDLADRSKYPLEFKVKCIWLHIQGMSQRKVAKSMGVSHVSVGQWVKSLSTLIQNYFNLSDVIDIGRMEIDELFTFQTKKK